jgi:hypothetical protein
VSNADIAPTFAHILKLDLRANGHLVNRVAEEALVGGPANAPFQTGVKKSAASTSGMKTVLRYEKLGDVYYLDCAGFEGRTVGLSNGG